MYSRFTQTDNILYLRVGNAIIKPVTEVRDLGVTFDSTLTLHNHINNICQSGSLSLHQIGKIRKFITQEYAERIVHAFVSSKLDYCNGILYGLLQNQIQKLKRLQNSAPRLVTRTKKSEHITPVLINLHWLPVQQKIIFKVLLDPYKALNGLAPDYLLTLLIVYKPTCSLRSSAANTCNLSVPKSRTTTYGDRSFTYACPKLCNQLPQHIKLSETLESFKSKLKTHLFKIDFNV